MYWLWILQPCWTDLLGDVCLWVCFHVTLLQVHWASLGPITRQQLLHKQNPLAFPSQSRKARFLFSNGPANLLVIYFLGGVGLEDPESLLRTFILSRVVGAVFPKESAINPRGCYPWRAPNSSSQDRPATGTSPSSLWPYLPQRSIPQWWPPMAETSSQQHGLTPHSNWCLPVASGFPERGWFISVWVVISNSHLVGIAIKTAVHCCLPSGPHPSNLHFLASCMQGKGSPTILI